MVAITPGEAAVMKRSVKPGARPSVCRRKPSHSSAAGPRSAYSTSAMAWGASAMRAASRRRRASISA
jgi:hypothetical protein